jgi:hypothetical protein
MLRSKNALPRILLAVCCLALLAGARAQAACVYPMSTQFGLADNFGWGYPPEHLSSR